MKTPITYYGGKINMVKHILPLIPENHRIFVEPFFGGGAVFFGKTPSKVEVINDNLDSAINFFEVCKNNDQFGELKKLIKATLHSETHHRRAKMIVKSSPGDYPQVTRAWAFYVSTNMSFSRKFAGGFAFGKNREDLTTINKIDQFSEDINNRLRHVQIFCRNALDVIRRFDSTDTLFYLDPPYPNSNCGNYNKGKEVYYELLQMLPLLNGRWILSSYPTPELAELWNLDKINFLEIEKNLSVFGKRNTGKRKIETLTWNYQI